MYHQIAANRRKSVLVIFLFFLFWLLAGYGIGRLVSPSGGIGGAIIAGILALVAVLYALTFGQLTVLSVSGARQVSQQD
ncbi:MAG: zinc metalloprotease HtpX, partial [Chloroflexi bacterium]